MAEPGKYTTLISVEQLKALKSANAPLMVFDCSFDLMNAAKGEAAYLESHIPGAVYVHLDRDLSDKTGAGVNGGRHPLPTREKFADWLGSVGFSNDMQAVVYDRQGANYCGRMWWMLKWVGHASAAVLDGGLQAWVATENVDTGINNLNISNLSKKKYTPSLELSTLVATKTIATNLGRLGQTLIDARATPRFKGEVEPLDPIAGHIPGALNRPFGLNIGPDGKFKPAAVLKAEFEALLAGRDPATVVHHCGSGVSAVPNLLAMEIAGLGTTGLYAGSWSEWCADPSRPVAQG
jgi:thiosulfate/3-mercaptopyruvate sulfurtransferase